MVVKKQLEPWDGHVCDGRPLVGLAGTSLEDCGSQEAVGAVGWTPIGGSSWDLPGRLW